VSTIEELIDSAIEAHEVSGDAMRWGPELPARTAPGEIVSGRDKIVDEELRWTASHEASWRPGRRAQVVATVAAVFFGALLGFVIAVVVL
jgi:hypothetical protein